MAHMAGRHGSPARTEQAGRHTRAAGKPDRMRIRLTVPVLVNLLLVVAVVLGRTYKTRSALRPRTERKR